MRQLGVEALCRTGLDVPARLLLWLLVQTLRTVGRHERLGSVALIIRPVAQSQCPRWEEGPWICLMNENELLVQETGTVETYGCCSLSCCADWLCRLHRRPPFLRHPVQHWCLRWDPNWECPDLSATSSWQLTSFRPGAVCTGRSTNAEWSLLVDLHLLRRPSRSPGTARSQPNNREENSNYQVVINHSQVDTYVSLFHFQLVVDTRCEIVQDDHFAVGW